jgi:PAS domain S-box-containing protein
MVNKLNQKRPADASGSPGADEALARAERSWQATFDASNDGICYLDPDQKILQCNRAMFTLMGKPQEEIIGRRCYTVVHCTAGPHPDCPVERMKKSLKRETMELWENGKWLEVSVDPVLDKNNMLSGIVHIVRDITERKRTEQALAESERRYRSIVDNVNDGFFIHDFKGNILDCNDNLCRMLGYSRGELVGGHLTKIDSPREQALMPERLKSEIATGVLFFEGEHIRRDGAPLAVSISARVVSAEGEGIVQSFVRDISERKRAEEALRESEEHFRTVFEQARFGMAMSDGQFRFFKVNQAFRDMLGYSDAELSEMTYKDISHSESLAEDIQNIVKLTKGELAVYKTQKRYVKKGGDVLWGDLTLSLLRSSRGDFLHYLVMVEDITAQKRAEEELQRAEKLESLKVFAGGIAHDFNNLLGGIFGYIDLARHELPKGSPVYEYLDKSFSAFERAKHLARQMLTFARGGEPVKKPVVLPDFIRDCATLALSGSSIKCEFNFDDDLWFVEADEHQLSQVFSNILINAWQAMPDGGTVSIAAKNRFLKPDETGRLPMGRYVVVTVKDEGVGIPEKIIDKIFDPFFTTKQHGSGLGLATSYSIITRHGGHIGVVSKPNEGSQFTIVLPAAESKDVFSRPQAASVDLRGSGRILVMDDERSIREMIADILNGEGYEAVITADGREAVEAFVKAREGKKPFDLVILDLTVAGGMGGEKTIKELKAIDPAVVAIVSSGYSDAPIIANFAEYGFIGTVPKPFRREELLLAVKNAVKEKGAPSA